MIWNLTQVAIGGAVGACLRYLAVLGTGTPTGTLLVNVAGSAVMGALWVTLATRGQFQLLLMTGVLGGFTTFSAFSLDAVKLWQQGQTMMALAYVAASVILSIAALVAGAALAKGIIA